MGIKMSINRSKLSGFTLFAALLLCFALCFCSCGREVEDTEGALTCTLSVSASTLAGNGGASSEVTALIPEGGYLFAPAEVEFSSGESVFDVLSRELTKAGIHFEFSETPAFNSKYIEGIGNIYEFDGGELSGWMYSVNGEFPNVGASAYTLCDGDVVKWEYTCDLGRDLGADFGSESAA